MSAAGSALAQYSAPGPVVGTPNPGETRSLDPSNPTATQTRQQIFQPTLGWEETLTSNANYDRGNDRKSDLVTELTPGFRVAQYGAHSSLVGAVSVPILLYARTGGDNNRVLPDVSLNGTFDAFDRRLLVESTIQVHRQFLNPLGAQPISAVSNSANEYTSGTYAITPILRGTLADRWSYEVKDLNAWTTLSGTPTSVNNLDNAYTNTATVRLDRQATPFAGGFDYEHNTVSYQASDAPAIRTDLARLRGSYAYDYDLQPSVSVGYENNDYGVAAYTDTIYGVGIMWRPSDRTSLDAGWEHRFFGSSWHVAFDHRTPRTVWTFRSSRDVQTYPEQLATLGVGGSVNDLLNSLFASRIPDPVARQRAVDAFIRLYGLPATLSTAVPLYSQDARLVTDTRLVAGFIGTRNNVYVTLYRNRNQSVVQAVQGGLVPPLDDVTQTGANMTWGTQLSSLTTLTTSLNFDRSQSNANLATAKTRNAAATMVLTRPVSGFTDFHVGIRYQLTHTNVGTNGEEAAIYAGLLHRFN